MGADGSYAQGDLFGGGKTEGTGTAAIASGKTAAAALRPAKAPKTSPTEVVASQDLVAGLQGDWAAIAREIDAKGRASSVFPDLVNRKISAWDVAGRMITGPVRLRSLIEHAKFQVAVGRLQMLLPILHHRVLIQMAIPQNTMLKNNIVGS